MYNRDMAKEKIEKKTNGILWKFGVAYFSNLY